MSLSTDNNVVNTTTGDIESDETENVALDVKDKLP